MCPRVQPKGVEPGAISADRMGEVSRGYSRWRGVDMLVLELCDDGDTWSGFGPKVDERNTFT